MTKPRDVADTANSIPSAKVTFSQDTSTAVSRSVESKLEDAVSVKDFGAVGDGVADDTQAVQAAFDFADGRPILLPAGTYKITSTLRLNPPASPDQFERPLRLIGDGPLTTFIDTRVANGFAIEVEGSPTGQLFPYKWPLGSIISGFTITTNNLQANSSGIKLRSVWNCDITGVRVRNLFNGTGIEIVSSGDGDKDTSANVRITQCWFTFLQFGIRVYCEETNNGGVSLAFCDIEHCSIVGCYTCGIYLGSVSQVNMRYSGVTTCGLGENPIGGSPLGGIYVAKTGASSANILLHACELGNNCKPWIAKFKNTVNIESVMNRFVTNDGESETQQAIVLEDSNIFSSSQDVFVIGNPLPTAYETLGSVTNVRITDPWWLLGTVPGETRYDFSAGTQQVIIEESGCIQGQNLKYKTTTLTTESSYTPDAFEATIHRVVYQGTGTTVTINAPLNPAAGRQLILRLYNASNTWSTVAFDPAFSVNNPGVPTLAKTSTASFYYDPFSAQWIQVGDWATNLS
jgi:hypothetical protein